MMDPENDRRIELLKEAMPEVIKQLWEKEGLRVSQVNQAYYDDGMPDPASVEEALKYVPVDLADAVGLCLDRPGKHFIFQAYITRHWHPAA